MNEKELIDICKDFENVTSKFVEINPRNVPPILQLKLAADIREVTKAIEKLTDHTKLAVLYDGIMKAKEK